MDIKEEIKSRLKSELESIGKTKLTDNEAWEANFNLSGFCRVLKEMKKEAGYEKSI
jgi:hypothetical protein